MRSARWPTRTGASLLAGIVGLDLVALGAFLPWVTLFAGLRSIPGYRLDGGYLSGIAVAAAALALLGARLGAGWILHPLALLGALFVTLDAAYVTGRISAFVADPGPAAPLSQPVAGPGAPVMVLGGALLLLAALAAPVSRSHLRTQTWVRLGLAAALFTAGWIHLDLTPEHLDESSLLGAGFGVAGLSELGLAAVTVVRPRTAAYLGIVFVSVALLFLYGYAVLVGLPFGAHDHGAGLSLGAGEDVDLAGVVSKLAELIALVLAVWLVGRPDGRRHARSGLRQSGQGPSGNRSGPDPVPCPRGPREQGR
jgi:hypothetical protein